MCRYELKGVVVSLDLQAHQVTINHDEIPGLMHAMTMAYPVKDYTVLQQLEPGDEITGRVVLDEAQGMWLEDITITKKASARPHV